MAALASSGGAGSSCDKSYHSSRLLSCILDCSSQSWLLLIIVNVLLVLPTWGCGSMRVCVVSHLTLEESSSTRNMLLQINRQLCS